MFEMEPPRQHPREEPAPGTNARRSSVRPFAESRAAIDAMREMNRTLEPVDLSTRSLWGPGDLPSAEDVMQGDVGSCWLLAVLAAFANTAPEDLKSLIEPQGNGRYLVHLDRTVDVGPVTDCFSRDDLGLPPRHLYASIDAGGWVAIIEKAVARRRPNYYYTLFDWMTWRSYYPSADNYINAHSGTAGWAMKLLGWQDVQERWIFLWTNPSGCFQEIEDALHRRNLVTLQTGRRVEKAEMEANHTYAVLSRDAGGFDLYDPLGRTLRLSEGDFMKNIASYFISSRFQSPSARRASAPVPRTCVIS